jgi:hypothetical protein
VRVAEDLDLDLGAYVNFEIKNKKLQDSVHTNASNVFFIDFKTY